MFRNNQQCFKNACTIALCKALHFKRSVFDFTLCHDTTIFRRQITVIIWFVASFAHTYLPCSVNLDIQVHIVICKMQMIANSLQLIELSFDPTEKRFSYWLCFGYVHVATAYLRFQHLPLFIWLCRQFQYVFNKGSDSNWGRRVLLTTTLVDKFFLFATETNFKDWLWFFFLLWKKTMTESESESETYQFVQFTDSKVNGLILH